MRVAVHQHSFQYWPQLGSRPNVLASKPCREQVSDVALRSRPKESRRPIRMNGCDVGLAAYSYVSLVRTLPVDGIFLRITDKEAEGTESVTRVRTLAVRPKLVKASIVSESVSSGFSGNDRSRSKNLVFDTLYLSTCRIRCQRGLLDWFHERSFNWSVLDTTETVGISGSKRGEPGAPYFRFYRATLC